MEPSYANTGAQKASYHSGAQVGQQVAGLAQGIPPKQPAIQEHANRLHDSAAQLADLNGRLSNILSRLHGPSPEDPNAAATPTPNGVLYVAQFGAEKINLEISKLSGLVSKLEQLA